jgi:hypothetical protein
LDVGRVQPIFAAIILAFLKGFLVVSPIFRSPNQYPVCFAMHVNIKKTDFYVSKYRYLQCEWTAKYPNSKRDFTTETFFGVSTKVQKQNNYYDCGIYLVQYVESFFTVRFLRHSLWKTAH